MNRNILILLFSLFIICILFIGFGVWLFSSSPSSKPALTPSITSITPTVAENNYPNSDTYLTGSKKAETSLLNKKALEQAAAIIKLRNTLPYTDNGFSLSYDIDNNIYTATIINQKTGKETVKQYLSSFNLKESDISLVIK